MKQSLFKKEKEAIEFIRKAESLALRMSDQGFHVAFSGGKDSQVLLALMELSGCKHHAEMQVTSVDSPNLMRFVRANYPNVKLNLPQKNMRQLILQKKLLPTRQARYCCAILKEQAGAGCCTCLGVRAAESARRAKRNPIEVIGQRNIGFEIINGKLTLKHSWGGNYSTLNKKRKFSALGAKIRLLFPRYSIGRTRMFGISSRETICLIATCTTSAFIALAVCFALWLHRKKNNVNLKCSLFLLKGFTFVLSVNSWSKDITTTLNPRNNVFNGG